MTPGLLVSTAISICLFGKPVKPPCPGKEAGLWQLVCLFGSSPLLLSTSPPLHLSTSPPLDLSTYSPPHLVAGEAKLSRFDAMLDYEQYVLLDWLPIRVQKFV